MPSVRDYESSVRDVCARSGLADPACAGWMAPLLAQSDAEGAGMDAIARALRAHGAPLTKEEMKARGYNTRMKLGRPFFDALTEKGRADPMQAAMTIAHHAVFQQYRKRDLAMLKQSSTSLVRITVVNDGRSCAAATALHGKVVEKDKLPIFPLPECDADTCRCGYQNYVKERHGPAARADISMAERPAPDPTPAKATDAGAVSPKASTRDGIAGLATLLALGALAWWLLA